MEFFAIVSLVYVVALAVIIAMSLVQIRLKRVQPGIGSYKRSGYRKRSELMRRRARRRVRRLLYPFMGAVAVLLASFLLLAFGLYQAWMYTLPATAVVVLASVGFVAWTRFSSSGDPTHELAFAPANPV